MNVGGIKDLHERMRHTHPLIIAQAVQGKNATWKDAGVTAGQIRKYYSNKNNKCLCYLSYADRPKKAVRVSEKSKVPGEIISADLIFKCYPESYVKDLGAFLFAYDCTGMFHVFVGRHKSQFIDCMKIVESWYRSWGYKIKYLKIDSEAVLMSQELTEWLLVNIDRISWKDMFRASIKE